MGWNDSIYVGDFTHVRCRIDYLCQQIEYAAFNISFWHPQLTAAERAVLSIFSLSEEVAHRQDIEVLPRRSKAQKAPQRPKLSQP